MRRCAPDTDSAQALARIPRTRDERASSDTWGTLQTTAITSPFLTDSFLPSETRAILPGTSRDTARPAMDAEES